MPQTPEQAAAANWLRKVASLQDARVQVIADIQRVIASIDHWRNTVTEVQATTRLLPADMQRPVEDLLAVEVLSDLLGDMDETRAALVKYRDDHQGM